MANRCAGLQTIRPHLPAPAPTLAPHSTSSSWLAGAAFDNEVESLTSTSPANVSELLSGSGGHRAPATALQMGTRAGRVTKRKPRPSTRRQTVTYVSAADPADFRRMVQEITGAASSSSSGAVRQQAAAATVSEASVADASAAAPVRPAPPASALILPMLDTSAFLLDRAVAPREPEAEGSNKSSSGYCASHAMAAAAVDDDDEPSVLQAPSFVSDFPTLESCWGI